MPCGSTSTLKTKQKPGDTPEKPRAGYSIPTKKEKSQLIRTSLGPSLCLPL